ncbi:MAG: ACP S-malonyltransferase [Actinomycetia bacterium]|nr:ACP S-malonyltransferase [Actinomycetes bacterium]
MMIAFTFPGQGSQTPGMGEAWIDHPSWELVAEAAEASGRDVEHLLLRADAEELKQTRNSQLATYVASMVVLDAVERTGVEPAFHAGHSLGEYSALTASGVLSFADGVRLVTERGNAMQAAADTVTGTMAAVLGLDDDKVDLACRRIDGDVWVANYNAPGQVVIAGDPDAIDAAGVAAKELGAKRVMPIKVGGAFHTPFMSPARDRLRKALADVDLRDPNRPVYANIDALPHSEGESWAGLLGAQLTSPVLWRHTLHALSEAGATVFLELGPGTILTGMAKRTAKGSKALSVSTPAEVDNLLEALSHASETGGVVEGELLYAVERLVVSPTTGVFQPGDELNDEVDIERGQIIGTVGTTEVKSAFAGSLQGLLALAGERVTTSQPLAWLRTSTVGAL